MPIQSVLSGFARRLDRGLGITAWLSGEPRPPVGGFDLEGEKLLDWGWICTRLPRTPMRALEVGPGRSPIVPAMLALGYEVVAVDFDSRLANCVGGMQFLKGDINEVELSSQFDVIVACSVIE